MKVHGGSGAGVVYPLSLTGGVATYTQPNITKADVIRFN